MENKMRDMPYNVLLRCHRFYWGSPQEPLIWYAIRREYYDEDTFALEDVDYYRLDLVAFDSIGTIPSFRVRPGEPWENIRIKKESIVKWELVKDNELPLLIGMNYTAPLLEQIILGAANA